MALSIGELDPQCAGEAVILAYEGGAPPASPDRLRLMVTGDAHGGCSVRDVVRIELKQPSTPRRAKIAPPTFPSGGFVTDDPDWRLMTGDS
ncbi:hypothetical protein [Kaistia sp. MMO-174]|uniref:hypothetical protein n=1 Tax=Kaistia sp. MMO-174 TaxID=3081256 RepID=UPI00301A86C0